MNTNIQYIQYNTIYIYIHIEIHNTYIYIYIIYTYYPPIYHSCHWIFQLYLGQLLTPQGYGGGAEEWFNSIKTSVKEERRQPKRPLVLFCFFFVVLFCCFTDWTSDYGDVIFLGFWLLVGDCFSVYEMSLLFFCVFGFWNPITLIGGILFYSFCFVWSLLFFLLFRFSLNVFYMFGLILNHFDVFCCSCCFFSEVRLPWWCSNATGISIFHILFLLAGRLIFLYHWHLHFWRCDINSRGDILKS